MGTIKNGPYCLFVFDSLTRKVVGPLHTLLGRLYVLKLVLEGLSKILGLLSMKGNICRSLYELPCKIGRHEGVHLRL